MSKKTKVLISFFSFLKFLVVIVFLLFTFKGALALNTTDFCQNHLGYNLSLVSDLQSCNQVLDELFNDTVIQYHNLTINQTINNTVIQYHNLTINQTINNTDFFNSTIQKIVYYENQTRIDEIWEQREKYCDDKLEFVKENNRHAEALVNDTPVVQSVNLSNIKEELKTQMSADMLNLLDKRTANLSVSTNQNTEPFYKQFWLWAIIILLLAGYVLFHEKLSGLTTKSRREDQASAIYADNNNQKELMNVQTK